MSMPIILFAGILFSDGILLSIGPCILIRPDIFKECLEPVSNLEALAYGYDAAYHYFEKLVFIIYIPLVHIPCFLGGMVLMFCLRSLISRLCVLDDLISGSKLKLALHKFS